MFDILRPKPHSSLTVIGSGWVINIMWWLERKCRNTSVDPIIRFQKRNWLMASLFFIQPVNWQPVKNERRGSPICAVGLPELDNISTSQDGNRKHKKNRKSKRVDEWRRGWAESGTFVRLLAPAVSSLFPDFFFFYFPANISEVFLVRLWRR